MSDDKLTITLTGRRPVKIDKDSWPILAQASAKDWDNQYEFQANRTTKMYLKVRQHEDGKSIVYGVYDFSTQFQGERGREFRAGEMLGAGDDIPAAIERVGRDLDERIGGDYFSLSMADLIHECIADLPAEEV